MLAHVSKRGGQSAQRKCRNSLPDVKYRDSQSTPTTTATRVEIAAPATPIGYPVNQPKIRIGASTMFTTTVVVCTIIPGLKLPVPRSAEPMATIANCSDIAGMNQSR